MLDLSGHSLDLDLARVLATEIEADLAAQTKVRDAQ